MMKYFHFNKKTIDNFSDENIENLYNDGYVFTREHKGSMDKIKSVRIDLDRFELTSENKRILKKIDFLKLQQTQLPYAKYSWEIGKLAKDFYDSRGANFSANKIKKLLTTDHNFNTLLIYTEKDSDIPTCYATCYATKNILHYSYPFYDYMHLPKDTGLGMILLAILEAKGSKLKAKSYIYLGSLSRYKLQFKGLEWFDGKNWQSDLEKAKEILKDD